ncbi:dTDP-4-dehydrorhamnose 3,5-epimerase [Roseibium aestuarii]|uniref:dTDP-4-dehydrorhamnose 3,5-epimerase n=1 Tax=Roseibium aestuarii TaxID=2600299 RepID=A0ABW4JS08_9HYPH|nr:dTDP-4-dehydrorhamnose 3,5-epimerase [Roseibium aestuarii]
MILSRQSIADVVLVQPKAFGDNRGSFSEVYRASTFADAGLPTVFPQENISHSVPEGTLRGLHYQSPPHAQGKLVRCLRGAILDVAVDIRRGSPTFGQHVAAELTPENGHWLWVPAGFAHGFCTLVPDTTVLYKVTDYYAPECDRGIAFDDPDLAIDWPFAADRLVLSPKDQTQPRLAQIESPFTLETAGAN